MALQTDYINEQNETIPNCYWKLGNDDGVIGGKSVLQCKIYCYRDIDDAILNQNELFVFEFPFEPRIFDVDNIFIQIYKELKEHHPLFENAIDV